MDTPLFPICEPHVRPYAVHMTLGYGPVQHSFATKLKRFKDESMTMSTLLELHAEAIRDCVQHIGTVKMTRLHTEQMVRMPSLILLLIPNQAQAVAAIAAFVLTSKRYLGGDLAVVRSTEKLKNVFIRHEILSLDSLRTVRDALYVTVAGLALPPAIIVIRVREAFHSVTLTSDEKRAYARVFAQNLSSRPNVFDEHLHHLDLL